MKTVKLIRTILVFTLLPLCGISFPNDIEKNLDLLELYSSEVRGDSVAVSKLLDSARVAYHNAEYEKTIELAKESFEHSKKL